MKTIPYVKKVKTKSYKDCSARYVLSCALFAILLAGLILLSFYGLFMLIGMQNEAYVLTGLIIYGAITLGMWQQDDVEMGYLWGGKWKKNHKNLILNIEFKK